MAIKTPANEVVRMLRALGYPMQGLKAGWGESTFRSELLVLL